ncbi:MAG: hypothetical protein DI535_04970 [Citrobacter freundii]|nr:MAG: hypothetical protein DI535_04970 [Citrobacter freundii]
MVNSVIGNFIETRKGKMVRIQFRKREAIEGVFIVTKDYEEMKTKNFWRIVTASKAGEWKSTKDPACARIFCGDEFAKLSDITS